MKWFSSAVGGSSASSSSRNYDEPRLIKMEKLETSSVVAADERDDGSRRQRDRDADEANANEEGVPPASLPPPPPPFREDPTAAAGSKSLDFVEVSTLESKVRRGVRVKKRRAALQQQQQQLYGSKDKGT